MTIIKFMLSSILVGMVGVYLLFQAGKGIKHESRNSDLPTGKSLFYFHVNKSLVVSLA